MEKILVIRLENINDRMTTDAVYKYMKLQNRPYSVNDVAAVLDKEKHTKNAIQKSLDKLVDNEKLFIKINAKQKVYCIIQEPKQNLDELKRIERELQTHSSEQFRKLKELENEIRSQEATFNSLKCSMNLEEAEKERDRLKECNIKLSLKLDELMENVGLENMSQLKKETEINLKLYNQEYSKRKRICNDILDCILESYPGSKKQLFSEIGINIV
ncbi:PREDICTED: homologous-pairing protein 2 homolog [Ceratosolen solmsi marchali]|uniref:Homologous-pairing protein 2 homolog n=1 Tax=Ceratosolen solmsi marchali TaxID=326594 RepID=A0AAJ7E1D3_9HYME|nr:PREDICTED: homologous-pairing protein 2 homolog [Ceratosolen solmsi marchali]